MNFVNPFLLAGAGLVAVPIVLHLVMRRKPRRAEFPALRFVRRRHDTNQRQLRLRHLLLLLLRMATAFALGKDYPRAARLATVLADHAMETEDREMLCPALGTIGVILMDSGQTLEARRVFDEILTLTDKTGDAHSRARALHNLGVLEALEKRDTRAVAFFEEAATVARSTDDQEVAELSGRFLALAAEAPVDQAASPPPPTTPPANSQTCPACQGRGLIHKEDYGMVLCPTCKGACRV
jgi:hypothetical protein